MKRKYGWLIILFLLIVGAGLWWFGPGSKSAPPKDYVSVRRTVQIKPDYTETVIPPNIAPLNFKVCEPGTGYLVSIHCAGSKAINVFNRNGKIKIPKRRWRSLLKANRGKKLFFDLYVKNDRGCWSRYERIENTIAKEDIDSHLVYRIINPIYNYYTDTAIYQRNLENFNESAVLDNKFLGDACVNCHSFLNNRPEDMVIGVRSGQYGSSAILVHDGKARKLGTKFGHTTWHPSGRMIAYSIYNVSQFFHTARPEVRDVIEKDSTLAYYQIDERTAKTTGSISDKQQLETHPAWSPDGRYLYFVSAPVLWEDLKEYPPARYDELKYSLMRISYDVQTDQWGSLETVLSPEQTGLSILQPRVSPDGRFVLFCMCEYSCFALFQRNSDLYVMDLQSGQYRKLEQANSESSESWHCWSSNSRWIAFSSKRDSRLLTRIYFTYFDQNSKTHKPFILPQKDPEFYESFIKVYNVPELITGPVKVRHAKLLRTARSTDKIEVNMPITAATPAADAAGPSTWLPRRK